VDISEVQHFWTSTGDYANILDAVRFNFHFGGSTDNGDKTDSSYSLCVRGGKN